MRPGTLLTLLVVSISILIFDTQLFAWDNKVTHRSLSQYAAEHSVLDRSGYNYLQNLGYEGGLTEKFRWGNETRSILLWLQDGAFMEDKGSTSDAVWGQARYNNHFHNPLKPWSKAGLSDLQSGESSVLWAQDNAQDSAIGGNWSWLKVRNCFYRALTAKKESDRQASFACTFEGLGHQMHLIQDMSVPAHVRNDAHPGGSVLGGIKPDWYMETWAKKNYGKINSFALISLYPKVSLEVSRNNLAPITQFIDSEQYVGSTASTSLAWGLAEYTNSNFVSDDTIFTEGKDVNDKHYFPYPRYSTNSYDMYEVENSLITKRIYLRKNGEGENIEHFVTAGPFFKWLTLDPELLKSEFKLDPAVYNDYAEKLIPRAVGYSSALIDYFFRGDIDMVPDDAKGSGYVIVNNTEEDMNGSFELWYDNENDERSKVWSSSMSIKKKGSDNKSDNIDFKVPSDAKERDKYMLVFQGKMGNEGYAVAGRLIKLALPVTGRLVQADGSSDGKWVTLQVYTESGLISGSFNIGNGGIIAVRFDLSDYDKVVVAEGPNRFHEFTIDETNMKINYNGMVVEYPVSNTDDITAFTCGVVGSPDSCVYYDFFPGPFKEIHYLHSAETDSIRISDFYYDSGSIKPFGRHSEDYNLYTMYAEYCGDYEMFHDAANKYKSEWTTGIYYGGRLTSTSVADCVGDALQGDSYCYADWDRHPHCSELAPGTEIDSYMPIAIFNLSSLAYAHYRSPYPLGFGNNSLSGCNYMVDLVSPVSLPCSVTAVKTMLRKDAGESFYYRYLENGQGSGWFSYSSGLGTIAGRYLVNNDNPYGEYIGWDSSGNIVKIADENGQLKVTKLKEVGGSFSDHFDVALKFPK